MTAFNPEMASLRSYTVGSIRRLPESDAIEPLPVASPSPYCCPFCDIRSTPVFRRRHRLLRIAVRAYCVELQGFRGRPAADLEALEDTLVRVSYLAKHLEGRLGGLDINPLMVLPAGQGVKAVDALVVFRGT